MAFDDIIAEIARLIRDMENRPENRHELYLALRVKLGEIRAMGMPVPDDLVQFEKELEAEFTAERHGPSTSAQPRPHRKTHRP